MPIDASIPLGIKVPDSSQQLSGLLGMANSAQTLRQNEQKTQQGGIDLLERQGVQSVLADPSNYTGADGTVDFNKALPAIMRIAPTTGMGYVQKLAEAQKAHTEASQALNNLTSDVRNRIGSVLAAIPPGSPPDLVNKTVDAIGTEYKGAAPVVNAFKQTYQQSLQQGGPQAGDSFIQHAARRVLPQETQQTMNTPSVITLDNGQQSVGVNVKPDVQGIPMGAPVQGTQVRKLLAPGLQQQVASDSQGNPYVVNRDAFGTITGSGAMPGAANSSQPTAGGPFALPQGETADTLKELQGERTAARQTVLAAPVMHDINHTIIAEASKPGAPDTGKWGALVRDVKSRVPGMNDAAGATDYDIMGKMLERSALTAAQSMGPHTNAGLEAAIKANGSLQYTPSALKKIAYLNDALTSGSELYQRGLENAISGSPNGVFAKRQFDQQWSQLGSGGVTLPQVLRLKNAVDNKNPEEVQNIIGEVGGKGTKGAQELHQKLTTLLRLSGGH